MDASDETLEKFKELVKKIRIAMLSTVEPGGPIHSRPMATIDQEFDGDLWFFTDAHSKKVDEVEHEDHVNLSYADAEHNRFLSVSGTALPVRDPERIRELWTPLYRAWFPKGPDDPELALLRVHVTQAEYWDTPSSAVVQVVGFAKAIATGERYQPGEHGEVELPH